MITLPGSSSEPYVLRQQADQYEAIARRGRDAGVELVPFGAVNVTPRTLECWAADLRRRANLIEGGRKPKR